MLDRSKLRERDHRLVANSSATSTCALGPRWRNRPSQSNGGVAGEFYQLFAAVWQSGMLGRLGQC
jgi:hypothetical protein